MNTSEFLNITSLIVPDRTAIIFDGKRISYSELALRVARLANALRDLGVKSGDRIATMEVNCNEHIEAYFAAAKLDAIYVPITFRATESELEYMLNDSSPTVVLAGSRYTDMIGLISTKIDSLKVLIVIDGSADGRHTYDQMVNSDRDDEMFP